MNRNQIIGVSGCVLCAVLIGVSFSFIKTPLFASNIDSLIEIPFFYVFCFSIGAFFGSLGWAVREPISSKSNVVSSVKVVSSGVDAPVKYKEHVIRAGSKLELYGKLYLDGAVVELKEPTVFDVTNDSKCFLYPKGVKAPEETKLANVNEPEFEEEVFEAI